MCNPKEIFVNTSTTHFATAAADSVTTPADIFKALGRTLAGLKEVGLFLETEEMSSEVMEAFGFDTPIYSNNFQELLEVAQSPLFGPATEEDLGLLATAQDPRIAEFAADVEMVRALLLSNTERTGEAEYESLVSHEGKKVDATSAAIDKYVQTHMAHDGEGLVEVQSNLTLSDESMFQQAENYRTSAQITGAKIEELMLEGTDILAQMADQDPSLAKLIADVDQDIAEAPLQFAKTALDTVPRLVVNALFR